MSKLVHNERLKYIATFFNNLGLAFLIAGALGSTAKVPMFDMDIETWKFAALGIFACIFCVGFAQVAILRHLKE